MSPGLQPSSARALLEMDCLRVCFFVFILFGCNFVDDNSCFLLFFFNSGFSGSFAKKPKTRLATPLLDLFLFCNTSPRFPKDLFLFNRSAVAKANSSPGALRTASSWWLERTARWLWGNETKVVWGGLVFFWLLGGLGKSEKMDLDKILQWVAVCTNCLKTPEGHLQFGNKGCERYLLNRDRKPKHYV